MAAFPAGSNDTKVAGMSVGAALVYMPSAAIGVGRTIPTEKMYFPITGALGSQARLTILAQVNQQTISSKERNKGDAHAW